MYMGSFERLVPDITRDKVGAAQGNLLSKKHPAFSSMYLGWGSDVVTTQGGRVCVCVCVWEDEGCS